MIVRLAAGAGALVVGLMLYPLLITWLGRRGARQHVASYSPLSHRIKEGTPTLGGLLFCALVIVSWLAFDRSRAGFMIVFALVAGAVIGAVDDVVNVDATRRLGLPGRHKLVLQAIAGVLLGVGLTVAGFTHQFLPGLGAPGLSWGLVPLVALAVVATSNAVNLTDGIDGLAASCAALAFFALAMIALRVGDPHVLLLASVVTGALLAFLAYNWTPARIFMGDTGSLALGCALVAAATELHLLWLLPLLGIVFLVETLSVIINVTAIRRYRRRVFRASPLHHHFEELGVRDQRLVSMFAAAAAVAAALSVLIARAVGATA